MPADPSIFGMIRPSAPVEGPLDQYGKVLNLRHLMGQGKLQDLQTQQAESALKENQDFKAGLASIGPEGETPEGKASRLTAIAPKLGFEYQKNLREGAKDKASLDHTNAQTRDIAAGHVAGAWASLAKLGGSDEAVNQVHQSMAPLVGEDQAKKVTEKLLSMPPEMRLPWMTAQAGQHKSGQEALKLFFPQAHMEDTGAKKVPISTSTMPGAPAVGTPIPGGVSLVKEQSPDSVAANARVQRESALTRSQPVWDSERGVFVQRPSEGAAPGVITPVGLPDKPIKFGPVQEVTGPNGQPTLVMQNTKTGEMVDANTRQPIAGVGPKVGESAQKQQVGVQNTKSAIQEYRTALAAFKPGDILSANARAKMGTVYNNMLLQAKEAFNLGVLNGPDYEILQEVITSPTSLKGGLTSKEALDAQAAKLDEIMGRVGSTITATQSGQQQPVATTAKAIPAPKGSLVAQVKTDSDFEKLKSGTVFIDPNGKRRVKP